MIAVGDWSLVGGSYSLKVAVCGVKCTGWAGNARWEGGGGRGGGKEGEWRRRSDSLSE